MAQSFNIVAQLQIQGGTSARRVAQQIQRQLSGINATVNIQMNRGAARSLKSTNKSLGQITQSLKNVTAQAALARKSLATLTGPLSKGSAAISNIGKAAKGATAHVQGTTQGLNQAATSAQKFGHDSALAVRRFLAFSIPAGIILGVVAAFKKGVSEAISFEREMIKVAQVTGRSISGLSSLTAEITKLSTSLGVASSELVDVARILSQTGLSAREVEVAMGTLARTKLAPTFKDIANTAEGAIAIMRQFGVSAEQLEGKLGSINAIAGSFAVEAQDLIFAIRRAGGAFKAAGGNLEELLALFTSVRATTRESAETIATGFRTIFTRMQRPRTIQFLKELGVNLQNLEGQFVGPFEAVRRLNNALSGLETTDPRFAQIVEELGGFRQVSKVIPLLQQFGQAQKALATAQRGAGSLARDAAKAQQTLAVQLDQLREKFVALFREIAGSATFKAMAQTALTLAESLITVGEALKPILPLMAALAAFKGAKFATQFAAGFGPGVFQKGGGGAGAGGTTAAQQQQNAALAKALTANTTSVGSNTASLNLHTTSLNNLTKAVIQLSSAVIKNTVMKTTTGAVPPIVRGGGFSSTIRGPGRPHGRGFARGGVVPGTGDRDTVPAMLQPGEFVIRKSSVNKLGTSTLSAMNENRYARGTYGRGIPPRLTQSGLTGKQARLDKRTGKTIPADTGSFKAIFDVMPGAVGGFILQPPKGTESYYSGQKHDFVLPPTSKYAKLLASSQGMDTKDLGSGVQAQISAAQYPLFYPGKGEGKRSLKMNRKYASAASRGVMRGLRESLNQTIKFVQSSNLLNVGTGIRAQPQMMDQTLISLSKDSNMRATLEGYMFEGMISALTGAAAGGGQASFDFPASSIGMHKDKLSALFGSPGMVQKLRKAEAKRSKPQLEGAIQRKLGNDIAADRGVGVKMRRTGQKRDKKTGLLKRPKYAGKAGFARKAKGGAIGSDTVPALLTPGEFVINRKSAQSIGYNNLRNVNRYAAGGKVTSGRHAYGSSPVIPLGATGLPMAQMAPSNKKMTQAAGDMSGKLMMAGFAAMMVADSMSQGNEEMQNLTSNIMTGVMAFTVLNSITTMLVGAKTMELKGMKFMMGAVAAAASALLIYGMEQKKAAMRMAEEAGRTGDQAGLQRAREQYRGGNRAIGGGVGAAAGAWGGAKIGAAIGTAIAPGIGTAIGGALGALGGAGAGYFGGKAVADFVTSVEAVDKAFRQAELGKSVENMAREIDKITSGRTGINAFLLVT